MNFYNLFKSIAFNLDPEVAHNQSLSLLSKFPETLATFMGANESGLEKLEGLDLSLKMKDGNLWSFPVGLAAGLDKNAEAISFFTSIPFGAVEVGTVTPKPQEGNPKPRMFRLKEEESLLNRMGFNNGGMEKVFKNLEKADRHGKVVGVNLGKNKITPQDKAGEDYRVLFEKFAPLGNYLVVNVSSPNTPGLRDLQNIESLKDIFNSFHDLRDKYNTPLYLKISPDLALEDLEPIVGLAHDFNLSGIIATNTTIREDIGLGGVSGRILKEKSFEVRKRLLEIMGKESKLELIGVGGISDFQDLMDFWKLGGRACQVYTSFIYQGPPMLVSWRNDLAKEMNKRKVKTLDEFFECLKE